MAAGTSLSLASQSGCPIGFCFWYGRHIEDPLNRGPYSLICWHLFGQTKDQSLMGLHCVFCSSKFAPKIRSGWRWFQGTILLQIHNDKNYDMW